MDSFGGARPKNGSKSKICSRENFHYLANIFSDMDSNTLYAHMCSYPGEMIEGLIDMLQEWNSKIKCIICWEDFDVKESIFCDKGHLFCIPCAKAGVEVQISDGMDQYVCFAQNCNLEFDLSTMQKLLEPKWFSKHVQKLCLTEVEKCTSIQMEYCPQCNFGMDIEGSDVKVIECKYEHCLMVSCRRCKKPAHAPGEKCAVEELKRCHQVENILTEAVVRKCVQCSTPYQKIDGCNRIRCRCGAQMCYLCKKIIKNYDHFSASRCPLYSNSEDLHKEERVAAGKKAVSLLDPTNSFELSKNPLLKN